MTKRCELVILCSLAFLGSISPLCVHSQDARGNLVGRAVDSTGAGLPNALVKATNLATNATVESTTNEQGNYQLLFLTTGTYSVSIDAKGFASEKRDNVEIRSGQYVPLDFTMRIGSDTQTVVVRSETPLLATADANAEYEVDAKNSEDLPTPYGNPRTLFLLMPGVNQAYPSGALYQQATLPYISSYLSVNGAPLGTTQFTLDGVPNIQTVNSSKLGISHQPPVDAISETKVETDYDASVGYTSGANLSMVLKSGTSNLHGSAYFYYRNPVFYANGFFAKRAGEPVGNFRDNRYGFTLGGPIYIPKVYHGQNRTFFFYSLEFYNEKLPLNPYTSSVPTAAERNGDFSALLALGPQYQIYDPATTVALGNGLFTRQPFANNIIPTDRISSLAQSLSAFFPDPNLPGSPDGTNNYANENNTDPNRYYNHTLRIDHVFSDHFRAYGHFIHSHKTEGPYNDYLSNAASGAFYYSNPVGVMADLVWTPNARWVVNGRYGYNHHPVENAPKTTGYNLGSLGFSSSLISELGSIPSLAQSLPTINVAGMATLNGQTASIDADDVHSWSVDVNRPIGNHEFKFGIDARLYKEYGSSYGYATPSFTFYPDYTSGPLDTSPTSPNGIGQGYASLLLGIPTTGEVDRNTSHSVQSVFACGYAQDNWRITSNLVITFGLRYEYEVPMSESDNRSVRGFDPNATLAVTATANTNYAANPIPQVPTSQFKPLGGLLYAGVGGQPHSLYDADKRKFMPRVGFAYKVNAKTAIRGGYGIYYLATGQPYGTTAIQTGYSQSTFITPSLNNGITFVAGLANPFPTGILSPTGNTLGVNTSVGNSISYFNTKLLSGYNQHWSLNIQREFPGKLLLEVGYVGSKAIRLPIARNINAIPNQYLSTLPVRDQSTINTLGAQISNPFYPLLPGTGLAGQTVPVSQLLRPYPQFGTVTTNVNQGYSWYHALQMRGERRFSGGVSLLGSYTFSRLMQATSYLNAADAYPVRSVSGNDIRHNLSMNGIYELPFGRDRRFLGRHIPVVSSLISGWQVEATWQMYSGLPLRFGNVFLTGTPNNIRLPASKQSINEWFNVNAFVRAANAQPLDNLITAPPYYSGVRAPIYDNVDTGLIKNTQLYRAVKLQLRAEAFNTLNHPSFAAPNTSVTSQALGTITGENGTDRQLQVALRLMW